MPPYAPLCPCMPLFALFWPILPHLRQTIYHYYKILEQSEVDLQPIMGHYQVVGVVLVPEVRFCLGAIAKQPTE